jgi:hypothetical protein
MAEYVLCHWGIKGMRWGIRRYQNRDGSLTSAGKQRLAERQIRTEENLGEKTIPKGTKMYRATPYEKDGSPSKSVYVTYKDADRNMYKEGTIVNMYTEKKPGDNSVYEHEFQLKTDVKIPSLKTVREIEKRVVSDEKARLEVAKSFVSSLFMVDQGMTVKDIATITEVEKRLSKVSTDEQHKSAYKDICKKYGEDLGDFYFQEAKNLSNAKQWVDSNDAYTIERSLGRATNVKNSIIKELTKLGYNAMYDNASIGVGSDGRYSKQQEGVEPLIIFDSGSTLQKTSTRQVSDAERRSSKEQYDQWKNDRDKTLREFR